MKLSEIGEFGLIGRIAERVTLHGGVMLGIGDDAAATVPTPGTVTLTTSDMLVEGIHFDLRFSDPRLLGRKSLAVNLSDIAAMGAVPRSCLLSLAIPPDLPVEFLDSFCCGLLERADQFGVSLIGGDTCASRADFVISLTLMGEQQPGLVLQRKGALPGDLICVTGTVGDSALGLELLRAGERKGEAVERHLDPVPRVREGVLVAERRLATAMIDVSDGLLADLGHIIASSGVGARVDAESLPLSLGFVGECARRGLDPLQLALAGGEDYELLFTVRPDAVAALRELASETDLAFTVVGEITDSGRLSVREGGGERPVQRPGYNHFT